MPKSAFKTLSEDLQALADEASDHLKDAALKTGADATEAVTRSTHAVARAAARLREEAEAAAEMSRDKIVDTVEAHPAAASVIVSMLTSAVVALAATFALIRLSQS
ncbi:MAG: hypothetical protein KJ728_10360 [Alphaproteobacteria bacterium]|uniref:hypothetical protein n=1 Tax=Brevundimonas sp. TaxID=1871086 RepID=UPI000DB7CD37|nr:hypothetical protein [Alphaproteobacteria bacterium]MBU1521812.1 hypothetical protein [Alphaproteobacteria bacterium]MBU2030789.1 hypothetical protein [Alphaproteobacteria bacterium]MBU2163850.1 hypothetical protein [Alphaproteobacteria bacterium]MBU2229716.1 hypothetical protein [Alphaproteobacteria bacterium]